MKRLEKTAIKGLLTLVAIIVITAAIARMLKRSQTLTEYANEHPEEQVKVEIEVTPIVEEEPEVMVTPEVIEPEEVEEEVVSMDEYEGTEARIVYDEGFFYEPVPETVRERMRGYSYPDDIDENNVCFDDLRYLNIYYVDFEGNTKTGEIVCNEYIAEDLIEIFNKLYKADYRLENVKLIDEYGADDVVSMADNNTSCFCYRVVAGTTKISDHAYGLAIDINPFYNPYIVYHPGEDDYISPPGSEIYADRSDDVDNTYRIDKDDLAYNLFTEHGFKWGGAWNNTKDYQHFYKKK